MSTISVRVTLLILATVMFSIVWSHDHKPEPARLHTVVAYEFPTICPVEAIEPVSREVIQEEIGEKFLLEADFLFDPAVVENAADELTPLQADKPQAIVVSELSFPLPRNLTIGEYRMIDRFGHVESISVTEEDLTSWGIAPQHDVLNAYEVCVGEDRWHFIRIEQPAAPAPSQADITAAWKSVFRFADRNVSPALEKASAPMARWLENQLNLSGEARELR